MSYNGHLGFGLLGDYDALPGLEEIAEDLKRAIASLSRAAGIRSRARRGEPRATATRANGGGDGQRSSAELSSTNHSSAGKHAPAS
jgi:hypothetical protein